jgi:multicomponent Na+:H+ antiporter subunit F
VSVAAVLLVVALVVLGVATLLTTVRLVRGPSALDRVVAVDVLVALILGVLVVAAALSGDSATIPVVVATSLVGFLGSTTVARFLGRDR